GPQVLSRGLPDRIQLYSEVMMDKLVAHSGHTAPGNVWISISHFIGQAFGGLTDDLQSTDNGKGCFVILQEILPAHPFYKLKGFGDAGENVLQIVQVDAR